MADAVRADAIESALISMRDEGGECELFACQGPQAGCDGSKAGADCHFCDRYYMAADGTVTVVKTPARA